MNFITLFELEKRSMEKLTHISTFHVMHINGFVSQCAKDLKIYLEMNGDLFSIILIQKHYCWNTTEREREGERK